MGTVLNFYCRGCGYKKATAHGGSMASFQTFSAFPVFCGQCQEVRTTNAAQSLTTCSTCGNSKAVAYGGDEVTSAPPDVGGTHASYGDVNLLDPTKAHKCPKCGEFAGKFEHGIMFD